MSYDMAPEELGFGDRGQGGGLSVGPESPAVWGNLCVDVSLVYSWETGWSAEPPMTQ